MNIVVSNFLLELVGGGFVVAWVYLYSHDVSKLKQIIPGDYLGG